MRQICDIQPGETFGIGQHEFILLASDINGAYPVLGKDRWCSMPFGGGGNYIESDVRSKLNGSIYQELMETLSAGDIVEHTVYLDADDGTNKGVKCRDLVSPITTSEYRMFRENIPAMGNWWWTATRMTSDESTGYSRSVCCVDGDGILSWCGCSSDGGVRPFFYLNPFTLVS